MKRKSLTRMLAVLLALSFTACQATPDTESARPQREVVDLSGAAQQEYAYEPEYPAIDALVALDGVPAVVQTAAKSSDEVRAVWVSYLEMAAMLGGKTEKQFTQNISDAFDNIVGFGLNTVIVQVRPFGDALYDSDYFPWSYTITGTEGKDPGFDPLEIMVAEAKAKGLRIEAWVNPYRIRASGNKNAISKSNPAKAWMEDGNGAVISYDGVISYNPASESARDLIVNGVVEIVRKYDVDGIHIDDYFYPTTAAGFDKNSYTAYKDKGGNLALADWRRSNVEKLIKKMYSSIKAEKKSVQFGISPQSSVDNNYSAHYFDVEKIAAGTGYCDYLCPQIYFGYNNEVQPYADTLKQWGTMVKGSDVKLYVGLASYKIGAVDSYAGSGKNEWTTNTDLLKEMVEDARGYSSYQGFALYRYDSIFKPEAKVKSEVQKENKNLKSIL